MPGFDCDSGTKLRVPPYDSSWFFLGGGAFIGFPKFFFGFLHRLPNVLCFWARFPHRVPHFWYQFLGFVRLVKGAGLLLRMYEIHFAPTIVCWYSQNPQKPGFLNGGARSGFRNPPQFGRDVLGLDSDPRLALEWKIVEHELDAESLRRLREFRQVGGGGASGGEREEREGGEVGRREVRRWGGVVDFYTGRAGGGHRRELTKATGERWGKGAQVSRPSICSFVLNSGL